MIYPKDIAELVASDRELFDRFGPSVLNHCLNVSLTSPQKGDDEFEVWMIREGYLRSDAVRRYLFFLATMLRVFREIEKHFQKLNQGRLGKKDACSIATTPEEMLYIARYLYYLDSYQIPGDVMECGSFKGFSSCCLSWVCDFLGRRLIIADSFQGLPESPNAYYEKSDFSGSFEEVEANIATLGKIQAVEFIKGWYRESLAGFCRPLMLLWMDVDLYESGSDVLNGVLSLLDACGVLFSHEIHTRQLQGDSLKPSTGTVAQSIYDYASAHGLTHKAKYLRNNLGIVVMAKGGDLLLSRRKQMLYENADRIRQSVALPNMVPSRELAPAHSYHVDTIDGVLLQEKEQPVHVSSDEISLAGWAVDLEAMVAARGVYADTAGKVFLGFCSSKREDIVSGFGTPGFLKCGFEVVISIDRSKKGEQSIGLSIVSADAQTCHPTLEKIRIFVD